MQISAVQTHHDLVAVASSRLEGSTWDGAVTLLRASASPSSSSSSSSVVTVELTRLAVHGTTYGIPALTWCGASPSQQPPLLAAAQDNGDVLLFAIKQEGVNFALLPTTTLADHDDLVSVLAAAPGGDFLATGGWDCAVRVWGLGGSSVRPLMNWQAHSDYVTALAWRGGGEGREGGRGGGGCQVASAGKDRCVKLWDVRVEGGKRECLRLVDSHAQIPLALAWSPSSPSSSSFSSSLPPSPPPGLGGKNAMHVDSNNHERENETNDLILSVAFDDGSVTLLDLRMLPQGNGKGKGGGGKGGISKLSTKAHKTRANALAFSPFTSSCPSLLASGGDDANVGVTGAVFEKGGGGVISFCTMADGAGMRTDKQHTDYVRGLGWLGTGERKGQGQEGAAAAAAAAASSLSLLPSPGVLLSGGWDGQLKGWGWREEEEEEAGEEGEQRK